MDLCHTGNSVVHFLHVLYQAPCIRCCSWSDGPSGNRCWEYIDFPLARGDVFQSFAWHNIWGVYPAYPMYACGSLWQEIFYHIA